MQGESNSSRPSPTDVVHGPNANSLISSSSEPAQHMFTSPVPIASKMESLVPRITGQVDDALELCEDWEEGLIAQVGLKMGYSIHKRAFKSVRDSNELLKRKKSATIQDSLVPVNPNLAEFNVDASSLQIEYEGSLNRIAQLEDELQKI